MVSPVLSPIIYPSCPCGKETVKRLQQLIFPAVACRASRCGDQCGTVRTRLLPALAKHFLQQAHWLNRSPLIASRR